MIEIELLVEEKVKKIGERLGNIVEKGKGDVGLAKLGKMVLLVEVLMEIASYNVFGG